MTWEIREDHPPTRFKVSKPRFFLGIAMLLAGFYLMLGGGNDIGLEGKLSDAQGIILIIVLICAGAFIAKMSSIPQN